MPLLCRPSAKRLRRLGSAAPLRGRRLPRRPAVNDDHSCGFPRVRRRTGALAPVSCERGARPLCWALSRQAARGWASIRSAYRDSAGQRGSSHRPRQPGARGAGAGGGGTGSLRGWGKPDPWNQADTAEEAATWLCSHAAEAPRRLDQPTSPMLRKLLALYGKEVDASKLPRARKNGRKHGALKFVMWIEGRSSPNDDTGGPE